MSKRRTIILGGGVAGLAAAWYLAKKEPQGDCILLEKEERVGGQVYTESREDFFIERGPRIFKTNRNADLLDLVRQLGKEDDLHFSSAACRYLWRGEKLTKMSPLFLLSFFPSLVLELFRKPLDKEETIFDFGMRRWGRKVTEELLDPLVLGVYGGDLRNLSLQACFPSLKRWELEHKSVGRALLSFLLRGKKEESSLFSFRRGLGTFLSELALRLPSPILYGQEALSLTREGKEIVVHTAKDCFVCDRLLVATPAKEAGRLLADLGGEVLTDIPYVPMTVLHLRIEGDSLPPGFGYLVPTKAGSQVLGVIFDSQLMWQEGGHVHMTAMIRGGEKTEDELERLSQEVLKKHLCSKAKIVERSVRQIERAIPQFRPGHKERMETLLHSLPSSIRLMGNYLEGVSFNDAVASARRVVKSL